MKSFKVPDDCPVPKAIDESGRIAFSAFVERFLITRPAFRMLENIELTDEIIENALLPAGQTSTLTSDACALLERELGFPGIEINWQLVRPTTRFQRAVHRAETVKEVKPVPMETKAAANGSASVSE